MRKPAKIGGQECPDATQGIQLAHKLERHVEAEPLGTSSGKNGHRAEFPLALAGRCIALTSLPGDLVLDLFVGAGTSAAAAVELNRRCVGYDVSEPYVEVAERRVRQALRTQLRLEEGPRARQATRRLAIAAGD